MYGIIKVIPVKEWKDWSAQEGFCGALNFSFFPFKLLRVSHQGISIAVESIG